MAKTKKERIDEGKTYSDKVKPITTTPATITPSKNEPQPEPKKIDK